MAPKRKRATKKDESTKSIPKPRKRAPKRAKTVKEEPVKFVEEGEKYVARFLDEPIPESEAKSTWPDRYKPITVISFIRNWNFWCLYSICMKWLDLIEIR